MQALCPMTKAAKDVLHEEQLGYIKDLVTGMFPLLSPFLVNRVFSCYSRPRILE